MIGELFAKYLHCPAVEEIFVDKMANLISCNCRYWRCNVVGAPSGKLVGKTLAIKDNISVAGVPMMNGSRLLEGYIPNHDATVVTRILDAGGTIAGKAVCEEFCFTATSCTSATGPVVNPYDQTRMALGSSSGSAALVRKVYFLVEILFYCLVEIMCMIYHFYNYSILQHPVRQYPGP